MTNIVSTLQIRLVDDVSAAGRKVAEVLQQDARRVKELQDALKASGTSDKLQASLAKLGASSTHIEGVTRAWGDFVKQEGIAGKATADLTRDQINAVHSWESVTKASVKAIIGEERSLTDATRREALARENAMRQEEAALRRKVEQEAALMKRLREQERHAQERAGFRHYVAGSAAMAVSAHGVVSGSEKVLEKGAELQHIGVDMQGSGISPAEIVRIEDKALQLSRQYGNISQTSLMEVAKEARSVLKDPAEVLKTMETLAGAKSVLDAKDASGEASSGLGMLVKGAESIGAAQDPERLAKLIDAYVRAIQVMGKTISPEQIYEFDKYAKTAGSRFSDRFLMTTGLSLAQEMGGSTAGNDIAQVSKAILGGFQNKHTALKEFARIGMIDPGNLDYLKTGEVKGLKAGTQHGIKGDDLAATDLDKWVYEVLQPHMEAAGMKTTEAQLDFIQKTFTGTQADVVSKLITQRSSFENHAKLYEQATGSKGAELNAKDAIVGLNSLTTSIGNLSAQVSAPAMASIGQGLNGLAGWINALAEAAKEHPNIAMGAGGLTAAGAAAVSGYVSWKIMNGFGLGTAATELTASAGAIDAAAGRLGMGGAGGGTVLDAAKKVAPALPALGAGALAGIGVGMVAAGGVAGAMKMPTVDEYGRVTGNWGGKDESANPSYIGPKTEAPAADPPNPIRMPARPYTPVPPAPTVDAMQFGARSTGVVPVSLVDGAASGTLSAAVAQGTYDGFMRVLGARGTSGDAFPGSGAGIVKASFEDGDDVRGQFQRASVDSSDSADQVRNAILGTERAVIDLTDLVRRNMGMIQPSQLQDDGGADGVGGANLRYGRGTGGGYRHGGHGGGGAFYGDTPDGMGRAAGAKGAAADRAMAGMRYLIDKKGWTPEGSAIALGNAMVESKVRGDGPAGDGGMSQHMFQWNKERLAAFRAFASARGKSTEDFETNLDFMDEERKHRSGLEAQWDKQKDLRNAGRLGHLFEGYSSHTEGERVQNARDLLARYRGSDGTVAGGSGGGIPLAGDLGEHLGNLKKAGVLSDEQCVTLAMASVGIGKGSGPGGNVHDWRKGPGAGTGRLQPGTPIATFLNRDGSQADRYAGGGAGTPGAHLDHAGIFQDYIRDQADTIVGMKIAEQYQGSHGIHSKDYYFGKGSGEGDASNYFAVKGPDGDYLGGMRNPMRGGLAPAVASGGGEKSPVDLANSLAGADEKIAASKLGHYMSHGEWCADFVNGVLEKSGVKGSGSGMSDSFRKWGTHVDKDKVRKGDVIVEYGKGIDGDKLGHAGFANGQVRRDSKGRITAYGMVSGNHDDKVIKDYWEDATRVTELRRASAASAAIASSGPASLPPRDAAPVLPRRAPPAVTPTPHDITAMNAAPGIDVSGIHEAIHHVRTLKQELASLGGVQIGVQHRGFSGSRAGGAGSMRSALNNGFASDGRHWT